MDLATTMGLVAGAIVVSVMILLGGDFGMFISDHAMIIIFGGSFAATLIRFPLASIFHGLPLGATPLFDGAFRWRLSATWLTLTPASCCYQHSWPIWVRVTS